MQTQETPSTKQCVLEYVSWPPVLSDAVSALGTRSRLLTINHGHRQTLRTLLVAVSMAWGFLLNVQCEKATADRITTVAGTGEEGLPLSEPADTALVSKPINPLTTAIGNPFGVEIAPDGSLYICEVSHHRVWRLSDPSEPTKSQLQCVAGTGKAGYTGDGGSALKARLNEPYEIRFDQHGAYYFVEMQNHIVRKVDARGNISTIAGTGAAGFSGDGGSATSAQLNRPHSIALDGRGSLFIADIGNHRIRRIDLATGVISTFAGTNERRLPQQDGDVTGHPVLGPRALFITGRTLWVALREGHSLWKIELDQPTWQRVAGTGKRGFSGDGGPALQATFDGPKGVVVDRSGNVYVVDTENQAIRCIDLDTGMIRTVAGVGPKARGFVGEDSRATQAHLDRPHGICVDRNGVLYIGDSENHRVRRIEVE